MQMLLMLALVCGAQTAAADWCAPASMAVAAGGCEDFLLVTSGTDAGLLAVGPDGSTTPITDAPGAGRNALVLDGTVFFKQCSGWEPSIRSWREGEMRTLLTGRGLCGPFPAPDGVLASMNGELLLLSGDGTCVRSWDTGLDPCPSACMAGDGVWLIGPDGVLWRIDPGTSSPIRTGLDGCATVSSHGSMVMVRLNDGTFSVLSADGDILTARQAGLWPAWTPAGSVTSCSVGGAVKLTHPGDAVPESAPLPGSAARPLEIPGWGLCWTDPVTGLLHTSREGLAQLALPDPGLIVSPSPSADPSAEIDVPWMHQRWDTPDWFNGSWSCGPSSCTMAQQYYARLTPDSIWCSSPAPGHWSTMGGYIPVEFTFLDYTYDILGVSPGDVWVPGAHGFICRDAGGAYWSYMALFLEQMGLESDWAGTSWTTLTSELDNSWPVVCSSTIYYQGGTYGHIILFTGYYEDRTVVVNDPYGDANLTGWGGSSQYPAGKACLYDWPGYNNGHLEIGAVNQLFTARHEVLTPADTLVDDLSLGFEKLGPCRFWHEEQAGYEGSFWWTWSTATGPDTCFAKWHPDLPWPGGYEVSVYLPSYYAEASAVYRLSTQDGPVEVTLDQGASGPGWASLGVYELAPGDSLYLGDHSGTGGERMAFDAALFSPVQGGSGHGSPAPVVLAASPNPARGSIRVTVPSGPVEQAVVLLDLAGREVDRASVPAGAGMAVLGHDLPPGVYLALLEPSGETCRAVVVR